MLFVPIITYTELAETQSLRNLKYYCKVLFLIKFCPSTPTSPCLTALGAIATLQHKAISHKK